MSDLFKVLLLPHLPLQESVRIGRWLLGPPSVHLWASGRGRAAAEGLLDKYEARSDPPTVVSVAGQPAEVAGQETRNALVCLGRALSFVGVDGNPDVAERGWSAHRAVTADNLILEGWNLDVEDGSFSTSRGQLVEVRVGGLRLDDPSHSVPVPIEIPRPEPVALDGELGAELLDYLSGGQRNDQRRQRLGAALDWLTLAWRNTPSVGSAPRVVFLRTALEALFPGSAPKTARGLRAHFEHFAAQMEVLRDRDMDDLLWSPTDEPAHPSPDRNHGLRTDLEDWFWAFNDVRNSIVHEGATTAGTYNGPAVRFQGPYFWRAERLVREVVRTELAISGCGDIWMRRDRRTRHRAAVAALAEHERSH